MSNTKWTDLSFLKHGSLTALEIEEEEDGYHIQRIRGRYGQEMGSRWRHTGPQWSKPRTPCILELEGRRISSGFCDNHDGELRSLVVETVGGEREVAGEHEPRSNRNLIESPPSVEPPLQLSHLSGDSSNCSVVFHYE